jgi:integrase
MGSNANAAHREPWNKGKIVGQKASFKLEGWVEELELDPANYGTHSMRRTKATLIDRRTKNLRAVRLLLGHSKLESTVRYVGIEVDDALEISEQTEIRGRGIRAARSVACIGAGWAESSPEGSFQAHL